MDVRAGRRQPLQEKKSSPRLSYSFSGACSPKRPRASRSQGDCVLKRGLVRSRRVVLGGEVLLGAEQVVQGHQASDATTLPVEHQDDAVGGIDEQALDMRDG